MTPEKQQAAIAKALGLVPAKESGLSLEQLSLLDGYSSIRPQYITDGWVSTDPENPQGLWLRGGCSQAVANKSIAEKWAEYHGSKLVVQVKMLRDIPDYLNDLNAMHEAEACKEIVKAGYARYLECLAIACGTERIGALVFATATQRAEAFLRTLNLWQE